MNGTSARSLRDGYAEAITSIRAAIAAVNETSPNGRDYYPQGDVALHIALHEHRKRIDNLILILLELEDLGEFCASQVKE